MFNNRISILFYIMAAIAAGFFLGNQIGWNNFGIQPREWSLSSIIGVFMSWTMHGDMSHLKNNSIALAPLLIVILLFEPKPLKTLFFLIVFSAIYVWCFGADGTTHIGASGLIYAITGYLIGKVLFGLNLFYLLGLAAIIYFNHDFLVNHVKSTIDGLVPQDKISFAGHFGGLIAGFIVAILTKTKQKIGLDYMRYKLYSNKNKLRNIKVKFTKKYRY